MTSYRPVDSKREEFRKYLEKAGAMDALTKVLVMLYDEPEKPSDALEYIRKHLGDNRPDDAELNVLKSDLEEARLKIQTLEDEIKLLKERLAQYEPPEVAMEDGEDEGEPGRSTTVADPSRAATVADPSRAATVADPSRAATVADPSRAATVADPSRAATVADPSRATTVADPSRAATVADPSRAGTVADPSRAGTVADPSRAGTVGAESSGAVSAGAASAGAPSAGGQSATQ